MSKIQQPKTTNVLTSPEPDTKIHPVWEYTEEQQAQIKDLREVRVCSSPFALSSFLRRVFAPKYAASITLPESDPYYIWEQRFLNKAETIPRYMRAAKWKMPDAQKRIKGTLEWRREYKPDLIPPDDVKIEAETGKIILTGFDNDGRPIIYMRPGNENTERSPRQLRHLVWWLERAKDFQPHGQESIVIIVDYKTTTLRTNPSVSVASKVLTILQQHYVETLGRAIVTNLPFLLNFFYKGISPFLDPVTRDKMRFNPDLVELIPSSQLDAEFGGEYNFEYDFETYWKQIVDFCGIAPDGTRLPGYFDGPKRGSQPVSEPEAANAEEPSPIPQEENENDSGIATANGSPAPSSATASVESAESGIPEAKAAPDVEEAPVVAGAAVAVVVA
ncbi:CRAL TRIO domain-containing protein [Coniophora puteana RWD-64-598 SS2]|uniref:CRAL TRIO domain-containing protein n=1 Tax=Coniophora puteana (strain RWD-64-598) TaxID=741705 RepID=A0A5M3N7G6_CONPW|nr:CRAL TRIO domain-containing protein [Coniophora puteana RWD-64-598 SS2]EIW87256.1 CRAL TRIO domain-containing protein [Coniophora puteana RWD-64-598 SS2]